MLNTTEEEINVGQYRHDLLSIYKYHSESDNVFDGILIDYFQHQSQFIDT